MEKPIKEEILEAIDCGRAKMRPKWHFFCTSMLLAVTTGLFFFFLLYFTSFIFFSMNQTGAWFGPSFGMRGWSAFFHGLPITLILLSVILALTLEAFVKRYAFAYQKPLLYSFVAIVGLALLGGAMLAPFHRSFFLSARHSQLPFGETFYRGYGMPRFQDIHRGMIIATTSNGFLVEDLDGIGTRIIVTSGTRIMPDGNFYPGNTVIVFGDEQNGEITAYGIRQISE